MTEEEFKLQVGLAMAASWDGKVWDGALDCKELAGVALAFARAYADEFCRLLGGAGPEEVEAWRELVGKSITESSAKAQRTMLKLYDDMRALAVLGGKEKKDAVRGD